jgi:hypothetical protein
MSFAMTDHPLFDECLESLRAGKLPTWATDYSLTLGIGGVGSYPCDRFRVGLRGDGTADVEEQIRDDPLVIEFLELWTDRLKAWEESEEARLTGSAKNRPTGGQPDGP